MVTKLIETLLTIAIGVLAAGALYFVLDRLATVLPTRWEHRLKPYLYLLPVILIVAIFVLYPALLTIEYAFGNADSTSLVGLKNFTSLLSSQDFQQTLINTLLWIIVAPIASIIIGLIVATLVDRLRPRGEKTAKTIIFLPMAIGAVGAATIWKFVYATVPQGQSQIGLQNAIWTKLGGSPINWVAQQNWHFNSVELIIMFLWGQVGFSMVLLSAAIKGVPTDTVEAARVDGASELQIFRSVIVPQIRPTIITVFITVLIGVMKIFDVIYVMTNGSFNTNVIGVEFYNQLFTNQDNGKASAIVVLLMIAVIPVMVYQVRHFRLQEKAR